MKAAKAANVACIGFINPNSGNQNLNDADVLIESFDGIDKTFIENTLLRSQGKPLTIASTKRLFIRELAVSDIPDIYPIYSDSQVKKYIDNIDDYLELEMENRKHTYKMSILSMDLVFGVFLERQAKNLSADAVLKMKPLTAQTR